MALPSVSLNSSPLVRDLPVSNSTRSGNISDSTLSSEAKDSLISSPQNSSSVHLSEQEIRTMDHQIKQFNSDLSIQFNLSDQGSVESFKIVNSKTDEIIMQIPSEQMLALRKHLDELISAQAAKKESFRTQSIQGLLFSKSI